jgi:hypothetical protein
MTMKLFHRTSYWGKDLHAYKARGYKLPIIQVQAILDDDTECDAFSFGCCRHHGRRCVQLDESHFLANDRDDWNLYHCKTVLGEESQYGDMFHDFALIPVTKATKKNIGKGWTLLGSVRACAARMDLAPLLRPFLVDNNKNDGHSYATHHVHVALAMTVVTIDDSRHQRPAVQQQTQQHRNNGNEGKVQQVRGERWQQPKPGMPFYSRNGVNTSIRAQKNSNATGASKKTGLLQQENDESKAAILE